MKRGKGNALARSRGDDKILMSVAYPSPRILSNRPPRCPLRHQKREYPHETLPKTSRRSMIAHSEILPTRPPLFL